MAAFYLSITTLLMQKKDKRIRVKVKCQLGLSTIIRKITTSLETTPSDDHLLLNGQNQVTWPTIESQGRLARELRRVDILTGHITVPKLAAVRKEGRKEERILSEHLANYPIGLHFQLSFGQWYIIKISNSEYPKMISSFSLHTGFSFSFFFF